MPVLGTRQRVGSCVASWYPLVFVDTCYALDNGLLAWEHGRSGAADCPFRIKREAFKQCPTLFFNNVDRLSLKRRRCAFVYTRAGIVCNPLESRPEKDLICNLALAWTSRHRMRARRAVRAKDFMTVQGLKGSKGIMLSEVQRWTFPFDPCFRVWQSVQVVVGPMVECGPGMGAL